MIFKFFTFSKKQQKTMWVLLAVKMCMQVSFAVAMFGVFNTHSSAVGNNIRRKDAILKIDIREHRLPVTSKGKVADNPLFRKVFQKTFKEQKIYLIPYFFDCTEQYIVLNPDRSPISIDKGTIGSNVTDPKKIWVESLQQILENNTIPVKDTFVNQSDCYAIEIDRENINKRLFITQKISDLSSDNEFINLFKDTSYSHVAKFVKLKCKTNAKCYFIFYYKNEKGNINFLSKDFERYFIFTGNQTQLNEKIPAALKDNFDIQFDKNIEIITLILKKGMHLRVLLIVDLTTQFDLHDVPKRYNYAGFSDIWQRYPNYRGTLSWIYEAIKNKNGIDLTDFEKTFLKQYESNEQYVSERVQKIQEIDKEKQQREALAEQKRVEK